MDLFAGSSGNARKQANPEINIQPKEEKPHVCSLIDIEGIRTCLCQQAQKGRRQVDRSD
jgi:hypothetical protein